MKKRLAVIMITVLVLLDQLTKIWAKSYLADQGPIDIIKGVFSLEFHKNAGIAFGMFQGKFPIFIVLTILLLVGMTYVFLKLPKEPKYKPLNWCLVFIAAGAIGNLIDRVIYNYVVDFLYFNLINFPIFNVADCYVTVTVILLMFLLLFYYKEEDLTFFKEKK